MSVKFTFISLTAVAFTSFLAACVQSNYNIAMLAIAFLALSLLAACVQSNTI